MPPRSKEAYQADEQRRTAGLDEWRCKFETNIHVAAVWARHEEAGGTDASDEEVPDSRGLHLHMEGFNPHRDSDYEGWGDDW
eukprot:560712-Rhodomonas_salina.1